MRAIRDQFGRTLLELGSEIEDMIVLTADLKYPTRTHLFAEKFPHRFFDVGVAEQNLIGISAGLAACGLIPVACSYANFTALRGAEQIRNDIAYTEMNVKVVALSSGLTFGVGGVTHQSYEDLAFIRALPHFTVIVPADAWATDVLTRQAVKHKGPVYLRLGRGPEHEVYGGEIEPPESLEIGKANLLRDGEDVTIIAMGYMVYEALKASQELEQEGIKARVIDLHTIKPIDREAILAAAEETRFIVTVEEHFVINGMGSAVLEVLGERPRVPVYRIGLPDAFPIIGPTFELRRFYGLCKDNIIQVIKKHFV